MNKIREFVTLTASTADDRPGTQITVENKQLVKALLYIIGEDFQREGLKRTPERVADSWNELYSGYAYKTEDICELLTQFDGESYDELVILKDIEFYSMCEHHMLPFFGKAHIGYIPREKIVGISKLARLLEVFARRLQVQERICSQVTSALMQHLQPRGAACIIEARHLCVACRGVEKQHSVMISSSLEGCMKEQACRQEFLNLISR